jgi:hypothetical protein
MLIMVWPASGRRRRLLTFRWDAEEGAAPVDPDEMELVGRARVALAIASAHPEFPAALREPVRRGVDAFRAWLPRYAATVKSVGQVEARAAPPRML